MPTRAPAWNAMRPWRQRARYAGAARPRHLAAPASRTEPEGRRRAGARRRRASSPTRRAATAGTSACSTAVEPDAANDRTRVDLEARPRLGRRRTPTRRRSRSVLRAAQARRGVRPQRADVAQHEPTTSGPTTPAARRRSDPTTGPTSSSSPPSTPRRRRRLDLVDLDAAWSATSPAAASRCSPRATSTGPTSTVPQRHLRRALRGDRHRPRCRAPSSRCRAR